MKTLKFFWESGADIILALLFIEFFQTNVLISEILLVYCLARTLVTKYVFLTIIFNLVIFYSMISLSVTFMMSKESDILSNLIVIGIMFLLGIAQVFMIIFRILKSKLEIPSKSKKPIKRFLQLIFITFDSIGYVLKIFVAIIYPIALSLTIILAFSGIYNSLNNTYNSGSEAEKGLYYTSDNTRLPSTSFKNNIASLDDILMLNNNSYIYFSSVTYFTIGYGDIAPKGKYMKDIVILEMFISHFLNLSIFALFGTLFYNFVNGKKVARQEIEH